MTMENFGDWTGPVAVLVVSAVGSLFACRQWVSRLAFFLLAPVFYLMLWLPITVLVGLLIWNNDAAVAVASLLTLSLYILNCFIFHNDGVGGVALVEGLGGTGPGGRNKGGGGDGGTTPPSPITYRRMSLK